MIYVFDSSAMIAYLRKETGHHVVSSLFADPKNTCSAHAANLCEVFYDFRRSVDEAAAQNTLADLLRIGLIERTDFDRAFWQEAARLKADWRKISLADCFGLVLAQRLGGQAGGSISQCRVHPRDD